MISKLPNDLIESLKEYLHRREKIFNAIEEVYVLNFDFRWILITNERIIVAIKRFFDYNFKDYTFESLDMDIDLGFFFDEVEFRIPAKNYKAHFYRYNRQDTLKFFHEVEKHVEQKNEEKKKENEKERDEDPCAPIKSIKELKEIYEEGVISEEEFQKKKKELLDKI